MVYRGHVVGGVVVLDNSIQLPDGVPVQVILSQPVPDSEGGAQSHRSIEEEIADIAAKVPLDQWSRLPDDLTDQLDHYVYGTPKG